MTLDPGLQRWRLILGDPAQASLSGLDETAASRDAALEWLYGRDEDLARRDVRRGGAGTADGGRAKLTTVDWLDQVNQLFPKETVERLERDAVDRYGIEDVVTDPAVLARVEPSLPLLRAVMRTKHLMNPDVLVQARRLIAEVVRELMERLAAEVQFAFSGATARRSSRFRLARNFDIRRTLRANLAHYQPTERRIYVQTPYFFANTRRQALPWQVIVLVDQSGSMLGSVIHSAVTAACLHNLPGIRTHLVVFDHDVVDLTSEVDDPVELLLKVQLGGGTDIAQAVTYGAQLIDNPRRTILILITDFDEGGDRRPLIRAVRQLVEQGTHVLGLAALDEEANPHYDRATAQGLANVGARIGAMTPGQLVTFVAEAVGR